MIRTINKPLLKPNISTVCGVANGHNTMVNPREQKPARMSQSLAPTKALVIIKAPVTAKPIQNTGRNL
jgi:hypothetical protein